MNFKAFFLLNYDMPKSCCKTKLKTLIIPDSSARPIVFLGTKTHPEKKSEKIDYHDQKVGKKKYRTGQVKASKLDLIDFVSN